MKPGIVGGIEWYDEKYNTPDNPGSMECMCARCGSSVEFLRCLHCDHGYVEVNMSWDDALEEVTDVPCEYCNEQGGSLHCISSPDWCAANPLEGREQIESTALRSEAWNDQ